MKLLNKIVALIFLASASSVFAEIVELEKLPKVNSIAIYINNGPQYIAATNEGLFVSSDGITWERSFNSLMPASMVVSTSSGELYAFVLTHGLVKFDNELAEWEHINNQFGSQVLMDISTDSVDANKLVALNQYGKMVISNDAGKSWHRINGEYKARSFSEKRGRSLYQEKCQSCHGIDGVGEAYSTQSITDQEFIKAPALDYSEHAWHHTDEALEKTILDGSPRSKRMIPWKKNGLTNENASDLVAYIKSLWTQRELDCQGPKHMQCMK